MLVIVEGPDGSGKSTLVQELKFAPDVTMLDRACTSEGGPVDDLAEWTSEFLNRRQFAKLHRIFDQSHDHLQLEVIDRFPLLSEPIYGPVCRGSLAEGFDTDWYTAALFSLTTLNPLIIYCLPPHDTVAQNVMREGAPAQMAGVVNNISSIYALYRAQKLTMEALGILTMAHDYTTKDSTRFVNDIKRSIDHVHSHDPA